MPAARGSFSFRPRRALAVASIALWLAPSASAGPSASEVRPFSGRYEGRQTIALLTATARVGLELRRSSRYIVYTMDSVVNWAFIERRFLDCSVIRIDGERLLPIEYLHRDESDPDHDVHTRFDWAAGSAKTTLGRAQETRTVALDGPVWDPMSFQVALIALAPQRRPGDREQHRVVERGTLKDHEVTFAGPLPPAAAGVGPPVHEIVSRKTKGRITLRLLPDEAWRPVRVSIDEVTFDLVPAPMATPASLPEGSVPSCEGASTR